MELTNKIINSFLCLCASAAIGAGGMYLYNRDKIKGGDKSDSDADKLISECADILSEHGYDKLDESKIGVSALNGYLEAYGDKYIYYIDTDYDIESGVNWVNELSCLATCGYEVGLTNDGQLEITSVDKDSVAEQYGFKVGDLITQVDDFTVEKDGVTKVAYELAGPDGSMMHVHLLRDNSPVEMDFKRANDPECTRSNVKCELMGKTAYVQFPSFTSSIADSIFDALDKIDGKYNSIIFDLRDNPGGDSAQCITIADRFIGDAAVKFTAKTGESSELNCHTSDDDIDVPVVLLVNENSASASEILTALFMQYGKNARSVGVNTFGKGVYQKDERLSNGGRLRFTAGYYTVGDWECYHGKGIKPDVVVEMDGALIGTKDDVQLRKALELLA